MSKKLTPKRRFKMRQINFQALAVFIVIIISFINITINNSPIFENGTFLTSIKTYSLISNAYASNVDTWGTCGGTIDTCPFTFICCFPCDGYIGDYGFCRVICYCRIGNQSYQPYLVNCYGPK